MITVGLKRKAAKFPTYNGKDDFRYERLRKSIKQLNYDLGARPMAEQEVELLVDWFRQDFRELSQEEVDHAFRLYVSGKLDFMEEKHFSTTKILLTKIIKAYKRFVMSLVYDYNMKIKNKPKPQKEATREDKIQIRRDYIEEVFLKPYRALKQGEVIKPFDKDVAFDLFLKLGKTRILTVNDTFRSSYKASNDKKEMGFQYFMKWFLEQVSQKREFTEEELNKLYEL